MPHFYKTIYGWFDEGFARVYDTIVQEAQDGDWIVEIGSYKGCSSVYLLEKIRESNKKLGCHFYDKWTGNEYGIGTENGKMLPEFLNNLKNAGFEHDFDAVAIDSLEAAKFFNDGDLFAVMLDGCHVVHHVTKEIDLFLPKIKLGGILAFHDYKDPNLRKLFNQKLQPIEDFDSTGLYRKL